MLGVLNTARTNKENIFYAILTIFLLERVRTGWNRIESEERKRGRDSLDIGRRQDAFVSKAALLYALPFLLPVLKYIYRSIEELSASVPALAVFKNLWVLVGITVVTEIFLAIVIYNLLRIYVDRMNSALGFFTKIGRNMWDGSKMAFHMSGDVGSHVVGRVKRLSSGAWHATRGVAKQAAAITSLPKRLRPLRLKSRLRAARAQGRRDRLAQGSGV